jgi:hypothetical protein
MQDYFGRFRFAGFVKLKGTRKDFPGLCYMPFMSAVILYLCSGCYNLKVRNFVIFSRVFCKRQQGNLIHISFGIPADYTAIILAEMTPAYPTVQVFDLTVAGCSIKLYLFLRQV